MTNTNSEINSESLLFYFNIFKKWKIFIIICLTIALILSTTIAFVLPKIYYSSATIKSADNIGLSLFSAVLGAKGLSSIGKNLNIGGLQYSDLDYYSTLLKSRKITNEIIKKYDLKNVYKKDYLFQTVNELIANTSLQIDEKSNTLIIGFFDEDPKRAQDIVTSYIELLNGNLKEYNDGNSKKNREFVEKRYLQNISDLKIAEDKMREFQQKNNVIIPQEQLTGTFKAISEIEAQKLLLQSKLSSLMLNQDDDSPNILMLKRQIDVLEQKAKELSQSKKSSEEYSAFVPLKLGPELISQYIDLYRKAEIQNKLLEVLYPLYEQSKMDESKNASSIVVIDSPDYPEYKVKPKRATIIFSGLALGLLLSMFFVISNEYIRKIKKGN